MCFGGTPGSSRCWAVASSDTAPVLWAIGAEVSLQSKAGERRIPVSELFRDDGIEFLNKRPDEILSAVHLPAPDDVLVLPSHGKPFRGAHERVAQLEAHHQARFAELKQELQKNERSAGELLPVLFRRPLDAHQTFFAMGEAIAHLHYLYYAGEAKRAAGADGIMRYAAR